jgi:hypothetical protein
VQYNGDHDRSVKTLLEGAFRLHEEETDEVVAGRLSLEEYTELFKRVFAPPTTISI